MKKKSPSDAASFLARFMIVICSLSLVLPASIFTAGTAGAQNIGPDPNAPFSLKRVRLIEPPGLVGFLNVANPNDQTQVNTAKAYAFALGKALLWDLQVGSDGKTACASCHFRAGTDHRRTGTLNPGANGAFNVVSRATRTVIGPTGTLTGGEFPFHQRNNPEFLNSKVIQDYDDAVGAQGIRLQQFVDIVPGQAEEISTPLADAIFKDAAGKNVRQVTRRNSPSYINAAFFFTAFHDGRANNVFNGVNNWGPADDNAVVFAVDNLGNLATEKPRLRFAALASQATAPPITDMEMSYRGRTWPKIGKKMLSLKPLAKQAVHPDDSVFGPVVSPNPYYPNIPLGLNIVDTVSGKGLTMSYADLIKAAFHPRYWDETKLTSPQHLEFIDPLNPGLGLKIVAGAAAPGNTSQFTLMEANFALFFGLAVQLYEMTLISDDAKFDRFQEGRTDPASQFTDEEKRGLETFLLMGCGACHAGPEFTGHSQVAIQSLNPVNQNPFAAIGVEFQPKFGNSFVDEGIYNISVRTTGEDVGRAGTTLTFDSQRKPALRDRTFPISFTLLALLGAKIPAYLREFVPALPADSKNVKRSDMVQGSFKVPSLRNVDLTGPYFHNGSVLTLTQIIDFYTRGGNFPKANAKNLHPAIVELFQLQGQEQLHRAMVAFLKTLTDERVQQEKAPFDHPELLVPNWQEAGLGTVTDTDGEVLGIVPAVGAEGRPAEGLPDLGAYLNANQFIDPFAP
jgi:cytochrome c peroxidase